MSSPYNLPSNAANIEANNVSNNALSKLYFVFGFFNNVPHSLGLNFLIAAIVANIVCIRPLIGLPAGSILGVIDPDFNISGVTSDSYTST